MTDSLREWFSLEGNVALVTGGGTGIGARIAIALAKAGAKTVVAGRRESFLQKTKTEIEKSGGAAEVLPADLSRAELIADIAKSAGEFFGAPDILVNAAGVNLRSSPDFQKSTADLTLEKWEETMAVNLRAPFFLSRAVVAGGMQNGGAILNIGSLQSLRAGLGDAAYGASKGGLAQLTRAMARAWGGNGVAVNALLPGYFPSDMTRAVFSDDDLAANLARATLLGRCGKLADIEGAAVFLVSPAARYITGVLLPVDGGILAK